MEFLWFLLIGAAAGWLAGQLMKSKSSDLVVNIVVGVIGAILGGWLFGVAGLAANGLIGSLLTATVGACVLIAALRFVKSR